MAQDKTQLPLLWTSDQPYWAVFIVLVCLAGAVGLELYRRRRQHNRLVAAEWDAARKVADEKELTDKQWTLLKEFLHRHAPEHPFRAITVRQEFDVCVESEMASLEQRGDGELLEERGLLLHDIRARLGLDYIPFGRRIHSTRELYHAQILWLAPLGAQPESAWHRMSVASVDEACFRLMPDGAGGLPALKPGEEARFRMWREEDARYAFTARLIRTENRPHVYVFRHTRKLKRTQSRAHFRVRYHEPTEIGIIQAPAGGEAEDLHKRHPILRLRGRYTSLSGGGFAVIVPQPVPRQVLLRAHLQLGFGEPAIEAHARIAGVQPLSGGEYLLRAAFVDISDEARDHITHFAFEQQKHLQQDGEADERE